jgi:hypothetical protein
MSYEYGSPVHAWQTGEDVSFRMMPARELQAYLGKQEGGCSVVLSGWI